MEYVLEDHFPTFCSSGHCRYDLRYGDFMERICFLIGSYQFTEKQTFDPWIMGFPRTIYSEYSSNAFCVVAFHHAVVNLLRSFGRKTNQRHDSRYRERIGDY